MNILAALETVIALNKVAEKIVPAIELAIRENRDITEEEWHEVMARADEADSRLAEAIRRKS